MAKKAKTRQIKLSRSHQEVADRRGLKRKCSWGCERICDRCRNADQTGKCQVEGTCRFQCRLTADGYICNVNPKNRR
ncbi:MAG: hypothetical protein ACYC1U_06765 [Candidatus Aquicultorales bacterium]